MKLIDVVYEQNLPSVMTFFDSSEISNYIPQRWKSRDKLIMMRINDFLNMAKKGHSIEKKQRVKDMIKLEEKFQLPSLDIDYTDSTTAKVVGHEGRHRARALLSLGYTSMPVVLHTNRIRWSEQNTPEAKFDYIQIWPKLLKSEDESKSMVFPVTRIQSTLDLT